MTGPGEHRQKYNYYLLTNRKHFFLNQALIVVLGREKTKRFRLIVYNDGKFLTDEHYKSIRGAKIAFTKYFKDRAYAESVIPLWEYVKDGDPAKLNPPLPPLTFKEK